MFDTEMAEMRRLESLYDMACRTDADADWKAYWELLEAIDAKLMRDAA